MVKKATYDDIIKKLADNYKSIESMTASQLMVDVPNHHPTEGNHREMVIRVSKNS